MLDHPKLVLIFLMSLSEKWAVGAMGCRNNGPSEQWAVGIMTWPLAQHRRTIFTFYYCYTNVEIAVENWLYHIYIGIEILILIVRQPRDSCW